MKSRRTKCIVNAERIGSLRESWLLLQPGLIAVVAAVGLMLFVCCGVPIAGK